MNGIAPAKIAEAAIVTGIALAVSLFGGTEPAYFAAVEVLFFAAAAWAVAKWGIPASVGRGHLLVPIFLAAWGLLQICPMPEALLRLMASPRKGAYGSHVLSLAPYQTRAELLVLLTCFAAYYLALFVGGERSQKRSLIRALVIVGLAEAFFGLIQYLANWQTIWWYAKKYDLEEATGTYINRNHFAGLLEMILPFAVGLALYEVEKLASGRSARVRRAGKSSPSLSSVLPWLLSGVVLMAALVFSRSRMGIFAASVSLVVMLSLHALQRRMAPVAVGSAFVVLSLSLAGWIGLRPALTRFEDLGQELSGQQETRLSIWPGAVKLIGARSLIGNGLGTFPVAYTPYQTAFLTKYVNRAHNDYLEFASDLGVPVAAVLFGSIVWVLVRALRTFFDAESRLERNFALACVGSIVAILLHSLTDFNLYIPANALVFAVIVGIASTLSTKSVPAEAKT